MPTRPAAARHNAAVLDRNAMRPNSRESAIATAAAVALPLPRSIPRGQPPAPAAIWSIGRSAYSGGRKVLRERALERLALALDPPPERRDRGRARVVRGDRR